ncbi:hypothetical protein B7494_g4630 [Chlorociboria aeruginascens]|nr:hypothetical protein B7494_g4630 [Chlorociboria aeruginascens]
MANIKPEDTDNSLWQGYNLQAPSTTSQHFESPFPSSNPVSSTTTHGGPHKGAYRSLDIPSIQSRPPNRDGNGDLTASPPPLNTHHSYPSLKRAFHSTEESAYGEMVQDFREDLSELPKPSINQDHRLLSFRKLADKHTIIDQHGRIQQIDLAAQIHGMFFLSEMTTSSSDGLLVQPELTCYRRNLFQISGSVTKPRGSLSLLGDRGERFPILSLEVTVSATESVDGHAVRLIVIPWKTPPPNSPEVGTGQEQEPSPIPLLPFDPNSTDTSDVTVYPIAYRRLQFRIATANNGRRRELQQHFTLHLNVVATLPNGTKVNACETSTVPIVVRGRSPRNFQARKEIPLVGASASRGQGPDMQLSTMSAPSSATTPKPKAAKPSQPLELPRAHFNFDTNTIPPSPLMMRQSTYPVFNGNQPADHNSVSSTPSYPPPGMLLENFQVNHENSDIPLPPVTTMPSQPPPSRHHFTYPPVIRRTDLYTRSASSSQSPTPDPELSAQIQSQLAQIYGSLSIPEASVTHDIKITEQYPDAKPQEFDFWLFSAKPDATPQRISIRNAEEDEGDGAFVKQRDPSYFFLEPASGDRKRRFDVAAVSGDDVLAWSKRRAWGMEVPWRVWVIGVGGGQRNLGPGKDRATVVEGNVKRKRAGKKRRIILRERAKKKSAVEELRRKEREEKEELEREKRTRRNREKKVKRKLKEKAKKAGKESNVEADDAGN